jgi:hypothetical protein
VIRCWECKGEVPVPYPNQSGRLARAMVDSTAELFQSLEVVVILAGALLITLALMVPEYGLGLGLALFAVAALGYGAQIRSAARDPLLESIDTIPLKAPAEPEPDDERETPRGTVIARGCLAVIGALALVLPAFIRNRGHVLPPSGPVSRVLPLVALSLALWLIMPLVLFTANAHDRHGPLSLRLALAALRRHLLAGLVALLVVPLALLVTEGLVALIALQQGQLHLMVVDLFPPPRVVFPEGFQHFYFQYDRLEIDKPFRKSLQSLSAVYPSGLRHGFTLTAAIPASLSQGLGSVRMSPEAYEVGSTAYLTWRIILTALILSFAGIALCVQARWLGLIAAVDARRPKSAAAPRPAPATETTSS